MATSTAQRVGIWIIAVAMIIGTVAGFLVMILAPQNEAADTARLQEQYAQYQEELEAYQRESETQGEELSKKYFDSFSEYEDEPSSFEADGVTELKTRDLKEGTGAEINEGDTYLAYYIGWNPEGKVFDQSIDGDTLKAPIPGGNLIEGWNEGVVGMKKGGVRLLSIPSEQAYGEQGSGEDIPANTPIKFVVMIIAEDPLEQPELPTELMGAV